MRGIKVTMALSPAEVEAMDALRVLYGMDGPASRSDLVRVLVTEAGRNALAGGATDEAHARLRLALDALEADARDPAGRKPRVPPADAADAARREARRVLDALGAAERSVRAALAEEPTPDGSRGGRPPTTRARIAQDAAEAGGGMQRSTPTGNGAPGAP